MLLILFVLIAPFGILTVTNTERLFGEFISTYNKTYDEDPKEFNRRYEAFKQTVKRIEDLNEHRSHKHSAIYGITEYSDLTPQEFHNRVIKGKSASLKHKIQKRAVEAVDFKNITGIPNKIDWRTSNIVTAIKNQDKCGACWAFSTVETIESMTALKYKNLTELSVQQMVDCSAKNNGCDGGDTCVALDWLLKNKIPLVTEKLYPFQDDDSGECKIMPKVGIQISSYTCDNFTDQEEEIIKLLAEGPVVAAVDASGWQDYLGGIIQFHCDTNRNHAVQIVGYDLTGDIPYYIVRNSWGVKFGLNGYLYIAIGKNLCAIAEEVSSLNVI